VAHPPLECIILKKRIIDSEINYALKE